MKTSADSETIDEILSFFDKIKKLELAMESLPDKFIPNWRERLKIKKKRKMLEEEIIQIRDMLRNKMNTCTNRR